MPYQVSGNLSISKVSPGTSSPTQVVPANPLRSRVRVQNAGANDAYLGPDATVTIDTGANPGYLLKGGQTPPAEFNENCLSGAVWAVAKTGATTLLVCDIIATS